MKIGLKPAQQGSTITELRASWTLAEEAGFDSLWTFDHFAALGPDPALPVFEAWTLLAAMAGATSRVRLGCLVTGNTYRHPAVLAKMAVTVDHLSAGRLEMGLGAGGHHTDLGLPGGRPRDLIADLDETCRLLKALWTEHPVQFKGERHTIDGAPSLPHPVQRPCPPIVIGTLGERYGLAVAARHADGWLPALPPGSPVEALVRLSGILDEHCAAIGRDPAAIRRISQIMLRPGASADDTLRTVEAHAAAGFGEIVLAARQGDGGCETAAALLERLR